MYTQATLVTAFDAEAGDVSALATTDQKTLWFNQGMARLGRYKRKTAELTWAVDARSVALPTDFVLLDKLLNNDGVSHEAWHVFGLTLIHDDPTGASGAGAARLYYHGEWPQMTAGVPSELNQVGDDACLNFALSRFYKKISSNRAYYKRYATIVGANSVSPTDLQNEADRYYQDFLDARGDQEPLPPATYHSE